MWSTQYDAYQEAYKNRLALGSFAFSPSAPSNYLHDASLRLGLSSYGMPRDISSTSNTLYTMQNRNTNVAETQHRATGRSSNLDVHRITVEPEFEEPGCCSCFSRLFAKRGQEVGQYQRQQDQDSASRVINNQSKIRY